MSLPEIICQKLEKKLSCHLGALYIFLWKVKWLVKWHDFSEVCNIDLSSQITNSVSCLEVVAALGQVFTL